VPFEKHSTHIYIYVRGRKGIRKRGQDEDNEYQKSHHIKAKVKSHVKGGKASTHTHGHHKAEKTNQRKQPPPALLSYYLITILCLFILPSFLIS